jgi:hypothetical protein
MYVPSLVKIHWRMLILEFSQGCYPVKNLPSDLDLWPWKSIEFQTLQRTKYVPSLVKIHWRILILVFTRMLYGKHLIPWPLTFNINRVPDSPKDYVCTKFCQNPLKDVDSRVFTRMLPDKKITKWPWKSIGFQTLQRTKYIPSLVKIHWRMLILECSQGCYALKIWPGDLDLWPWKSIGFQILLRTKYVPSVVKTIEGCWS